MKGLAMAGMLVLVLSAAPAFAQAAGQTTVPPQTAKPVQQTPPPAPPVQPPAPFPAGAKIGVVNLQAIASNSSEGKAASARVQALIQKKQAEGQEKSKQLQANQQKLQQSGTLMNDAAKAALEKEIEKQNVEGQRFQQDAQAEINELQQELQGDFQKKLFPILTALAQEKGLHLLLSYQDAGVIWAEPGVDLTAEAIKKLDGAAKPGAPKQ